MKVNCLSFKSWKLFYCIGSLLVVLIFVFVLSTRHTSAQTMPTQITFGDPEYKTEMDKWNWLTYSLLDKQFKDELFRNPDDIANKLGLDTEHKAKMLEVLNIPHAKDYITYLNNRICDKWPCPPIRPTTPQ